MKRIIYFSISVLLLAGCSSENEKVSTDLINNPHSASAGDNDNAMPIMDFDEESFDFGNISQGEKVEHSFSFTNTGDADLIISSAIGSCGCTIPSYPKEPVKPGQSAEIQVVFDSNGKHGAQHKRVTIVANTVPNKTLIAIMANVLVPEKSENE